eukprot:TRINITY_DN5556_c0_g1_i2.p1 TRINITY_DN5556_c0_g1~~TRINITY_DN5556_c0_g1_i2.p1  ORF type:complete len:147 (-),score=14.58 TRINITY_DN5556_c0_g1_i2:306-746(-)
MRLVQGRAYNAQRMLPAFSKIYENEGSRAFFRGLLPSVLGASIFYGVTFMSYDILERLWDKSNSLVVHSVNGCIAASLAQTFSYPLYSLTKEIQSNGSLTSWGVCKSIIKQHGITGLWRGTTTNLIKVIPFAGTLFATYEGIKDLF